MKSLGFSLQTFVERNTKLSGEKCEKHGLDKLIVADGNPFCIECQREKVNAETEAMGKEAMENYERMMSNKHVWLEKKSLLGDMSVKGSRFSNYEAVDKETEQNLAMAKKQAERYLKGEVFTTVLQGKPGTGKTHLGYSILKHINENNGADKKCLMISVDELFRTLKAGFGNRDIEMTEKYLIGLIREADFVFLDDLGAESGDIGEKQASKYVVETMYGVANALQNKPVILTTNLSSDELMALYGRRLVSRMLANSRGNIIKFENTTDKRLNFGF